MRYKSKCVCTCTYMFWYVLIGKRDREIEEKTQQKKIRFPITDLFALNQPFEQKYIPRAEHKAEDMKSHTYVWKIQFENIYSPNNLKHQPNEEKKMEKRKKSLFEERIRFRSKQELNFFSECDGYDAVQ